MARLPSGDEIGLPNAQSGRGVASYDVTGYARGAAAMAKASEGLGDSIAGVGAKFGAMAKEDQQKADQLEQARAKSDFFTEKVNLDSSVKDDQDHSTLPKRYDTGIREIQTRASQHISDPRTRELFVLATTDDVAKGNAAATSTARTLWKDATLADSTQRLGKIQDALYKTTDPDERVKLIDTGNDLITDLADKGIYSREGAVLKKQEWIKDYAKGTFNLLPPQERIEALRPFAVRLATRESGGQPNKVNDIGYAGLYQFGAPRLTDLGIYSPGKGERLGDWSKTGKDAAGKWTGRFNIPGFPEVTNINEFLSNGAAQKAAYAVHETKMDQEIQSNGFDKYIGQTVGGVAITRDGLQAMLHLGGVGGTRKTLESDGANSPKDKYGTSVLDYAKLGVSSGAARVAQLLPEPLKLEMLQAAEKEQATIAKATETQRKADDKETAEVLLKEAFSRANENKLTPDFIESVRPYVTAEQYKNLLQTQSADPAEDSPDAIIDLTRRIDTENPEQFQKSAEVHMREGRLKTGTYISLSEKNRIAAKDDQPASPYRAGRDLVKTTLDPGQLLSGPAAAIARSAQAQAMTEFDNWAGANPRATREELVAESQNIIKRYQVIPFEQMKLAIGVSKYFGPKSRNELKLDDVDAAEDRLAAEMQTGRLTKAQQEFEIRLLTNWREILARDAAPPLKEKPRGK